MTTRAAAIAIVALVFVTGRPSLQANTNQPSTEFVGTTPCTDTLREFVGGTVAGPSCPAITWQLNLGATERNNPGWSLTASFAAPTAANPRRAIDHADVSAHGRLEKTGSTYRLISESGRSISFRQLSSTLIHVLDDRNRLMPGTSAYSYTLGRADALDDPGQPELSQGESYRLSPLETGTTVFGIFGGRTPCMGIARALHIALNDGCQRLKWRITLLQKPGTQEPTTYTMEGSLHHPGRTGAWRIVRGTALDPNAVVYQLDGTASQGPLMLWKADDDVLFFLDERRQPLVGTVDFSYSVSRSR